MNYFINDFFSFFSDLTQEIIDYGWVFPVSVKLVPFLLLLELPLT
ncbi:MAG: hypothetical protein ABIA63_13485 [bacterium]